MSDFKNYPNESINSTDSMIISTTNSNPNMFELNELFRQTTAANFVYLYEQQLMLNSLMTMIGFESEKKKIEIKCSFDIPSDKDNNTLCQIKAVYAHAVTLITYHRNIDEINSTKLIGFSSKAKTIKGFYVFRHFDKNEYECSMVNHAIRAIENSRLTAQSIKLIKNNPFISIPYKSNVLLCYLFAPCSVDSISDPYRIKTIPIAKFKYSTDTTTMAVVGD